jgi:hypothetical protein
MFDTFDRTGSAEFPFPKPVVFKALSEAVARIRGMTVENVDALAGRIDIKTGMSAFSWGERVSISVSSKGTDAASVSIGSGARTIFGSATVHGKNRQNVKDILEATSRVLQAKGDAWRAQMAPTPVPSTPALTPAVSVADELMKLAALRDSGVLSAEEFNAQKAKILSR